MEKGIFVNEITDGAEVRGLFLVRNARLATTRNGNPYLALQLADKTGEINAKVWDNAEDLAPSCPEGGFVAVNGQAQSFQNALQIRVAMLSAVPADAVDLADFVPRTAHDIDAMWRELRDWTAGVGDADYRRLLDELLGDAEIAERFKRAPAAKHMHHAYLGGLLEHTLAIVRLADAVSRFYPDIDRDLLVTAAIVHDIGKVLEFSYDTPAFDYSERGRLEGHLVLGAEFVSQRIARLDGFDERKATLLRHCILSHHGRLEFGSPTLPMVIEALVLNLLDDLDAKANYLHRLAGEQTTGQQDGPQGEEFQWSAFQRPLERFLFLRRPKGPSYTIAPGGGQKKGRRPAGPRRGKHPPSPPKPAEPPPPSPQPSLFD